jgi:hypothetical protein
MAAITLGSEQALFHGKQIIHLASVAMVLFSVQARFMAFFLATSKCVLDQVVQCHHIYHPWVLNALRNSS